MLFRKNRWALLFISFLIGLLLITACAPVDVDTEPATKHPPEPTLEPTLEPTQVIEQPPAPTETTAPTLEPTATTEIPDIPEEEEDETIHNPLSPDPVHQVFQTSDGLALDGIFYPAETIKAPLIVLMHWAPGDQEDWRAIAPWLQNRGIQNESPPGDPPWQDSGWFPSIAEGESFNVFTFTFRGCEGGCQSFDREGWLIDVEAAMAHIIGLENVDLSRVAMIGASIGADGVVIGCHLYNNEISGCQGALSLSPGGYLTIPYADQVVDLEDESPPKPTWCFYGALDVPSANACQSAYGEKYQSFEYPDQPHGMALLTPDRDPNPMELILQFLYETKLCTSCEY